MIVNYILLLYHIIIEKKLFDGPLLKQPLTSFSRRECKHHNVIKRPAVVGVRRVEGHVQCGTASQIQKEGGVNHGNRETTQTLPLTDRLVVWGALVITLRGSQKGQDIIVLNIIT